MSLMSSIFSYKLKSCGAESLPIFISLPNKNRTHWLLSSCLSPRSHKTATVALDIKSVSKLGKMIENSTRCFSPLLLSVLLVRILSPYLTARTKKVIILFITMNQIRKIQEIMESKENNVYKSRY